MNAWVVSRLRVLKTPLCFWVQFWFPAGQHHGRHPGPSAKGALCCYQVQTLLHEVRFLQQTPGGPAQLAAGGPVSQGTPALILVAPLTPARSCYYNTRRASGSHAQCWGGGVGWGAQASHSSVTGCTSHFTSQTCPRAPAQHPRRPSCPFRRSLLSKPVGSTEGAKGTHAKAPTQCT